jgi:hypothetical protein
LGRNKPEEICGFQGCLSDWVQLGQLIVYFCPFYGVTPEWGSLPRATLRHPASPKHSRTRDLLPAHAAQSKSLFDYAILWTSLA